MILRNEKFSVRENFLWKIFHLTSLTQTLWDRTDVKCYVKILMTTVAFYCEDYIGIYRLSFHNELSEDSHTYKKELRILKAKILVLKTLGQHTGAHVT
jgi:hypothetical protein